MTCAASLKDYIDVCVSNHFGFAWDVPRISNTGEKLKIKTIEGIGDKIIDKSTGETKKIGAGGWGGGVNLAVSNETIQKENTRKLKKWLKKQRKRVEREKAEKEAKKRLAAEGEKNT